MALVVRDGEAGRGEGGGEEYVLAGASDEAEGR